MQIDARVEDALRAALKRGLMELCRILAGPKQKEPIPLLAAAMALQAEAFKMELEPAVEVTLPCKDKREGSVLFEGMDVRDLFRLQTS